MPSVCVAADKRSIHTEPLPVKSLSFSVKLKVTSRCVELAIIKLEVRRRKTEVRRFNSVFYLLSSPLFLLAKRYPPPKPKSNSKLSLKGE